MSDDHRIDKRTESPRGRGDLGDTEEMAAPDDMMSAWQVMSAGEIQRQPRARPKPAADQLLIRVLACALCRTDLHLIDHELPPRRPNVVPGHQIVGRVVEIGADVTEASVDDLVGAAWLASTDGRCQWCIRGQENLCPNARFTGWDIDGGFAEFVVVKATYAYRLDPADDPITTSPLLCAGLIGYRSLKRAVLPPAGVLGIYGFGSSAHLTVHLAMAQGASVSVMTRGEQNRELARRLGAAFVGEARDVPPTPLDSAIVFAPVGDLMPVALRAVARGGTVVSAGIHMSTIPPIDYDTELFGERDLRSVTANTRTDGREFLALARAVGVKPIVTVYPFRELPRAVDDMREGHASGTLVIDVTDQT